MKSTFAAVLLAATLATPAAANEPVVAPESLNHFLSGVRDFAGGKLTPGPLYDPQGVGLPSGSGAIHVIGASNNGVPINNFYSGRPASWRAANGSLAGGYLVRNTIVPTRIVRQIIVRQPIITSR